ncbi:MAG TPA: asparaginase domain-containing protein [Chakrabartia sp.]|nr:asparaginase domain-containing protein [Chakrabartia sp.]
MIRIFTTGGTIDKVYFDALSEFEIGASPISELLREANFGLPFAVTPLMRKDSLELTDADRETICAAVASCEQDRVLVTHGTDTMPVTGRLLQSVPGKTIVLTGAMLPASQRASDAFFNVGFAMAALQTLPHGTYITMGGQIFDPSRTVKDRANNRFVEE